MSIRARRNCSEIVWLLEICWNALLGYKDAVSWLNKAKTQIFQPTVTSEIFKIYLYFICQPAVRPGCTRCRAPETSHDKGNRGGFTKMLFRSLFFFIPLARYELHLRR